MTITIVPASSNSGRACIAELIARRVPAADIRACSRTSTDFPAGVEAVSGIDAMDKGSLSKAFTQASSALIVTPHDARAGMDQDAQMTCNMIQQAVDSGVTYIVLVGSWT
ncbi:hypothetical protein HDV03_001023, partial [Kappamyces sp. JEL0829]